MLAQLIKGMFISGSLIVAIGSQNAFVLKQALLRNHIFVVCVICFLCDFVLMSVGVFGVGQAIKTNTTLTILLALAGTIFLFWYGAMSFWRSFKSNDHMELSEEGPNRQTSYKKTAIATLAVTLLNPHVYLDTVVIVGGYAATLDYAGKAYFLIGALLVSLVWFFALGYGARLLTPVFAKPRNWRILEFVIGCIMWYIAFEMGLYAVEAFRGL